MIEKCARERSKGHHVEMRTEGTQYSFEKNTDDFINTYIIVYFFFNDTATTEIYTLSLHDALPICLK